VARDATTITFRTFAFAQAGRFAPLSRRNRLHFGDLLRLKLFLRPRRGLIPAPPGGGVAAILVPAKGEAGPVLPRRAPGRGLGSASALLLHPSRHRPSARFMRRPAFEPYPEPTHVLVHPSPHPSIRSTSDVAHSAGPSRPQTPTSPGPLKALQNWHWGIFMRAEDLFDEMYASLADRSTRQLLNRVELGHFANAQPDLMPVVPLGVEPGNESFDEATQDGQRREAGLESWIKLDQHCDLDGWMAAASAA